MKSPFKFLDSFTKDDKEIFFGRDKETEELYHNPHCSFFCKIIKKSVDNSCFYQQLQSAENVLLRLSAITL